MNSEVEILPDTEEKLNLKTLCKECIFATYHDNDIQSGCKLHRLEIFQNRGKALFVDNNYEIDGFCNFCRNKEWDDSLDTSNDLSEQAKLKTQINTLNKETNIRLDILLVVNGTNDTIETIKRSLDSIKSQAFYPSHINIGIHLPELSIPGQTILRKQIIQEFTNSKYIFTISFISENMNSTYDIIDLLANKLKGQYYTVLMAGDTLPKNWMESLNILINHKLDNFSMMYPIKGHTGFTAQSLLHRVLVGNKGQLIQEKIEVLAKDQNTPHMIKKWEDVSC